MISTSAVWAQTTADMVAKQRNCRTLYNSSVQLHQAARGYYQKASRIIASSDKLPKGDEHTKGIESAMAELDFAFKHFNFAEDKFAEAGVACNTIIPEMAEKIGKEVDSVRADKGAVRTLQFQLRETLSNYSAEAAAKKK